MSPTQRTCEHLRALGNKALREAEAGGLVLPLSFAIVSVNGSCIFGLQRFVEGKKVTGSEP
jgi:hypothetical protein